MAGLHFGQLLFCRVVVLGWGIAGLETAKTLPSAQNNDWPALWTVIVLWVLVLGRFFAELE